MGARLELLKFRKTQGLTQTQFAKILGITATHYSRIETGQSNPSFEIMEKLKINFKVEDVFGLFEKC